MNEKKLWEYLRAMYTVNGTWDAVARELGLSKQYLSYCVTNKRVTAKLLKAMNLEARYEKVGS